MRPKNTYCHLGKQVSPSYWTQTLQLNFFPNLTKSTCDAQIYLWRVLNWPLDEGAITSLREVKTDFADCFEKSKKKIVESNFWIFRTFRSKKLIIQSFSLEQNALVQCALLLFAYKVWKHFVQVRVQCHKWGVCITRNSGRLKERVR